ncbi:MAG: SpoIIE family protein phosphatase [bacterium]|nr:SpoIIE family protein phosphatase [bacterium]
MKIRIFALCYVLSLLVVPSLFAMEPINLDTNTWWVRKGFEKSWIEGDREKTSLWIKKHGLPLRIRKVFPGQERDRAVYTAATHFRIDSETLNSVKSIGLKVGAVGEAWQLYVNDRLVKDQFFVKDNGEIAVNRAVRGSIISIPSSALKEGGNWLFFRMAGNPQFWRFGLYHSGYQIDEYETLQAKNSEMAVFMLISIYLFVAFYHILLFLLRRRDQYNLYFGLFGMAVCGYFFTRTNLVFEIFTYFDPNPVVDFLTRTDIILRIEYCVLFTIFPFMLLFLEKLFFNRVTIIARGFVIFSGLLIGAIPFVPLVITEYILIGWQISGFVSLVFLIYLVVKALVKRVRDSFYLLPGVVVMAFTTVFDILDSMFLHTGIALSKYGLFVYTIGIAGILANRFVAVHKEAEDLNVNLDKKVRERTDELKQSLDDIRALKNQQDGDYYLTSLLMKPLGKNDVVSDSFKVKEITKQNKNFVYQGKNVDIGGDLNIATNLELRNRNYIAFINSDAMGKSIQGAGGAIVTGVLYNAFINRTRAIESYRMRFPEQWLEDCFLDLQNVFITFEGSMIASLTMGLIDEETGFMYYINAEHPWMVRYHDGTAEFIEQELEVHKIGLNMNFDNLEVKTCQFQAGDIIILGSDGRDDIQLEVDAGGNRTINRDENFFLKHVQQGEGSVDRITASILESGTLIDDYSILSISFNPGASVNPASFLPEHELPSEIQELIKNADDLFKQGKKNQALSSLKTAKGKSGNNPRVLKEVVKLYARDKKYKAAFDVAEQYCEFAQGDVELLYLASYTGKMAKEFEKAADYGERCCLRDRTFTKNLFNLADIYRIMNDETKAGKLLQQGLLIDDSDAQALRLKKILSGGA